MTIQLSAKIKKEVSQTIKEYGYQKEKDFFEDALCHWVLELKKTRFFSISEKIRNKMVEKKISEKEILVDFDKFIHQK